MKRKKAKPQYGLLRRLGRAEKRNVGTRQRWFEECQCRCGTITWILRDNLRSGNSRNCGCIRKRKIAAVGQKQRKHGLSLMRVYIVWRAILFRCTNPRHALYPRYGGRGITIDPAWQTVEGFLADMGHPPSDRHEIDRIDNDGPYTKSNCRWATHKENCRNKSTSRLIEAHGETRCLSEWAEMYGIQAGTIAYRLNQGWTPEAAIQTPVQSRKPRGLG